MALAPRASAGAPWRKRLEHMLRRLRRAEHPQRQQPEQSATRGEQLDAQQMLQRRRAAALTLESVAGLDELAESVRGHRWRR